VISLAPAIPGTSQIGWSSDGQFFAAGGTDRVVRVWSETGRLVATSPVFNGQITDVAWRTESETGPPMQLIVAGNFDPYSEDGWVRRAGGHVEVVDVSYLYEDSADKTRRVHRLFDAMDLVDLESRCQRLLRDRDECVALRQWIDRTRSRRAGGSP
jgi:hypothetical protein